MSPLQRIIHRGIYLLCPILLFLIGAYALVQLTAPPAWRDWLEWHVLFGFKNGSTLATWAVWAWALLLVLLPFFLLILYLQRAWVSTILVLKTDSGQPLKIRETAVNRYLHDRLLSLPYVRSARVRSKAKGGGLALFIRVWVASQQPLNNIQERVLTRVTEDAQQGFGISRILPPDLQFESVQTGKEGEMDQAAEESSPSDTFAPYPAQAVSTEDKPAAASASTETESERESTPGNRWGS